MEWTSALRLNLVDDGITKRIRIDNVTFEITNFAKGDDSKVALMKGDGNSEEQGKGTLLLYTTSGNDRHIKDICLNMRLLARPETPQLLSSAHILIMDNAGIAQVDEGMQLKKDEIPKNKADLVKDEGELKKRKFQDCLREAPNQKKNLYMSAQNVGYRMGAVQAIDVAFKAKLFEHYTWVVHMHPDVFLIHPTKVVHALETTKAPVIADPAEFLYDDPVSKLFGVDKLKCFLFDFFAFKPREVSSDIFSHYASFKQSPECYLGEKAFNGMQVLNIGHKQGKKPEGYRTSYK